MKAIKITGLLLTCAALNACSYGDTTNLNDNWRYYTCYDYKYYNNANYINKCKWGDCYNLNYCHSPWR